MTDPQSQPASTSNLRIWLSVMLLVAVAIAAAPWVISKTTLRDRLLNAIVNSDEVTLSTTNASFGYFSPLSLDGLRIRSNDDHLRIEVPSLRSEHSWLGLLLSRPELGTFYLQRPQVDLLLELPSTKGESNEISQVKSQAPSPGPIQLPNLAAQVRDASIVVRTPQSSQPPIDLKNIQLAVHIEQQPAGPVLRIEPGTILDRQRITPELSGRGLQLIVPLLADEVSAEGEFSLSMEQFVIPLQRQSEHQENDLQVEGMLQLHQASVSLRNTLARKLSELVLKLIGAGIPDRLTVARDLVVTFQVIDGRVHHEGLALLLPYRDASIVLESSGSVGLDESLDLVVAVKLPDGLLGGGAIIQRMTSAPILLTISGTLKEPKVDLARRGGLIDSIRDLVQPDRFDPSDPDDPSEDPGVDTSPTLGDDAAGDVVSGAVDALGDLLGELRERAEQRRESGEDPLVLPNLRRRLRDRPLFRGRREAEQELTPQVEKEDTSQAEGQKPSLPEPVDL